jgi:hypothetical protein
MCGVVVGTVRFHHVCVSLIRMKMDALPTSSVLDRRCLPPPREPMLLLGWVSGESATEGKATGGRHPPPYESDGGQERARVEDSAEDGHGTLASAVEETSESVRPELPHVIKREKEGCCNNGIEDEQLDPSIEWVGPSRASSQLNVVVVGVAGAVDGVIIRCWRCSENRGGLVVRCKERKLTIGKRRCIQHGLL